MPSPTKLLTQTITTHRSYTRLGSLRLSTTANPSSQRRTLHNYLVTPADLASALSRNSPSKLSTSPRTIPLCATWFMPNDPQRRTALTAFKQCRIPTARLFDLDAIKDDDSPYPHMLPRTTTAFASAMGKLGIRRDDAVVVYDDVDQGIFSAPRVAWTLRAFGHDSVGVLNNFKLWCEQGYPTDSGIVEEVERVEYVLPEEEVGKREKQRVIAFEELKALVQKGGEDVQILDARSEGRWSGKDPEPRPGLSSGHIPYSKNLPFTELLDPRTKAIRPADDIRAILESKRVDMSKPVIASCGTGVTAAVIHAALLEAGYPEDMIRLYDGSWTEWAQRVTEAEGLIKKSDRE